jgi:hypothetical protein
MDILHPYSTPKTEAEECSEILGQNTAMLRKTLKTMMCIKGYSGREIRIIYACVKSKKYLQTTLPSAAEVTLLARLRPTPERRPSATVKALLH